MLGADFPASLREGVLEASGVQFDSSRDVLTRRKHVAEILPAVNREGRYSISVVAFCDRPPRLGGGPQLAASYFDWAFVGKPCDLPNSGAHLPPTEDGPLLAVPEMRVFRAMPAMRVSRQRRAMPRRNRGWVCLWRQKDHYKIASQLGTSVGATAQKGISGLGWAKHSSRELYG